MIVEREGQKRVSMFFGLDLIARIDAVKRKTGISVSEFVRRAIVKALEIEGL